MKSVLSIIASVICVAIFIFLVNMIAFGNYAFFQPRVTAVQNQTFHASQQYTDSKLNALRQYETQYSIARTDDARSSIRAMVRDEFATYDERNLDGHPDLQAFLSRMENGS